MGLGGSSRPASGHSMHLMRFNVVFKFGRLRSVSNRPE